MTRETDFDAFTTTELQVALSEADPEATYGAVPVIDQYDALEAYRAYDDGALEEVPEAFAVYLDYHQRHWS